MRKMGGNASSLKKIKRSLLSLELAESFLLWREPILVQLGMLCDLAGAAEAGSFVEGLCTHSHYANGAAPASLLIMNM